MSVRKPKPLSPANFEIMKVIWKEKEVTINQVHQILNRKRVDKIARTSVQVQMNRLEKYGWLMHRKNERTFIYSPVFSQKMAVKDILNDIRERIFGGCDVELVKSLFKTSEITEDSIQEIKELLNEYSQEGK